MSLRVPLAQPELVEALPSGLSGWDWFRAALILLGGLLVAKLFHGLVVRWIERSSAGISGRLVGRVVSYLIAMGGLIYALASLRVQIGPLLGALGIGGLALAIAMQTTLENFVSGIFLETRRPFRRGDQIGVADHEGVVEDLNLRATLLRTFDGRRVVIPNGMVLNGPIVNFTSLGSLRTEFEVGVAYDSDLPETKRVVAEAVRACDGVLAIPEPRVFVERFADSSVQLSVHFWHGADRTTMWATRDRVAVAVRQAFDREGITIPFPQIRLGPQPRPEDPS